MAALGLTSVPWEVARSWSTEQALAASIVAGETHGATWDWAAWCWRRPEA